MKIFIVALREKTGRGESPGWTWLRDTTRSWDKRGRAREELPIKTPAEMPRDWHRQNGWRKGSPAPGSEWFPVGGWMRGARRSQWYWGMLGGLASISFDMLIDTSVSHLSLVFETNTPIFGLQHVWDSGYFSYTCRTWELSTAWASWEYVWSAYPKP